MAAIGANEDSAQESMDAASTSGAGGEARQTMKRQRSSQETEVLELDDKGKPTVSTFGPRPTPFRLEEVGDEYYYIGSSVSAVVFSVVVLLLHTLVD